MPGWHAWLAIILLLGQRLFCPECCVTNGVTCRLHVSGTFLLWAFGTPITLHDYPRNSLPSCKYQVCDSVHDVINKLQARELLLQGYGTKGHEKSTKLLSDDSAYNMDLRLLLAVTDLHRLYSAIKQLLAVAIERELIQHKPAPIHRNIVIERFLRKSGNLFGGEARKHQHAHPCFTAASKSSMSKSIGLHDSSLHFFR